MLSRHPRRRRWTFLLTFRLASGRRRLLQNNEVGVVVVDVSVALWCI